MGYEPYVGPEKIRELFDESCRPAIFTIGKWARAQVIPSHKIGGKRLFRLSEVREHLEKRGKVRAR